MKITPVALFLLVFPTSCLAASFDSWHSEHKQLVGKLVVAIGSPKSVSPPIGKQWQKQVYEIDGTCFVRPGYAGSVSSDAAMIVVDKAGTAEVALLSDRVLQFNFDLEPISLVNCPYSDPQQLRHELEDYQEKFQRETDEMRRRKEELKKDIERYANELEQDSQRRQ